MHESLEAFVLTTHCIPKPYGETIPASVLHLLKQTDNHVDTCTMCVKHEALCSYVYVPVFKRTLPQLELAH